MLCNVGLAIQKYESLLSLSLWWIPPILFFPLPLCLFITFSMIFVLWGDLLNHTGIGATWTRALSPQTTEKTREKRKEKQPYNNLLTMDWLPPRGSGQQFNMRSWEWPAVDQLPLKGLEGNPWQYNPQEVKKKMENWIQWDELEKCVRVDVARKAVVAQLVMMWRARYTAVRMSC